MNAVLKPNHTEDTNRQTIEAMVDAFVNHDLDAMMALFNDDCRYEDMIGRGKNGQVSVGKQAIRQTFASQIKRLPPHTFENAVIIVSGNQAHANWDLVMGNKSEYRVRGCDYFELQDGKITLKSAWLKNHDSVRWQALRLKLLSFFE